MQAGRATARHVRLVMRPHRVLDACMRVVSVVHWHVPVAVAGLGRDHGRCIGWDGRRRSDGGATVILLLLLLLLVLVCGGGGGGRRGHLAAAVVSSRSACGRVWIRLLVLMLPLGVHGGQTAAAGEPLERWRGGGGFVVVVVVVVAVVIVVGLVVTEGDDEREKTVSVVAAAAAASAATVVVPQSCFWSSLPRCWCSSSS